MASEEILREIRRKIDEGNMPEAVVKELADGLASIKLLDKPVAVRSSATAEDSVTASFAGVHESFLNIMGLERICKAVKGCYASLWTPRSVAYRRRLGINDDEVAVAVVIMELVSAEAAGVAFSCDPRTGRRDILIISANFGLGESVVGGAVEPDEYLLWSIKPTPEIIEKKIGVKKLYTKLKQGGGTELVSTSADDDKRAVLSDEQITELGFLTLRAFKMWNGHLMETSSFWSLFQFLSDSVELLRCYRTSTGSNECNLGWASARNQGPSRQSIQGTCGNQTDLAGDALYHQCFPCSTFC